jgi:hypothetical protein
VSPLLALMKKVDIPLSFKIDKIEKRYAAAGEAHQ